MTTSAKTPSKAPTKTLPKATSNAATKSTVKPATKAVSKSIATASKVAPKKVNDNTGVTKITPLPVAKKLTEKPIKAKKIKLVRDSFTIPKPEYLILDNLKLRAADLKHPVKKSELLRAGIKALAAMTDAQLLLALKAVPMLKTGRPSK
ncbi:MAG: hypothetical protein ABL923_01205 [Burkholderiaceae bacterium]